jgi:hypothetical protein
MKTGCRIVSGNAAAAASPGAVEARFMRKNFYF